MAENDLTKPATTAAPASAEPEIHVDESNPTPIPAEGADTTPAAAAEDTQSAAAADDTTAAGAKDDRKPEKLPKWADDLIRDKAIAEREARREAKRLKDENDALRKAAKPTDEDKKAAEAAAPAGGYGSKEEFEAAVRAETEKRIDTGVQQERNQRFIEACNTVFETGKKAFSDSWDAAVGNLGAIGAIGDNGVGREVLDAILESDEPDFVIYELGRDMNRAQQLLAMTPSRRAMEIGKIAAAKANAPKPRPSNAPRPVEPVEGTVRVSDEPQDSDDDQTWFKKREAQLARRSA